MKDSIPLPLVVYRDEDIKWLNILDIKRDYYKITRDGTIFIPSKDNKIMKPFVSNRGYIRINLATKEPGSQKKHSIHRLVALLFVENPNPKNFNVVNHKDGDPWNNDYTNLEWTNDSGNMIHAYDHNLAYTKGTLCHLSKPDKYPDELIHAICKLLENHVKTRSIIEFLGLVEDTSYNNPDYNRYKHYINDLRAGKQRRDISSQYAL